MIFMHILFSGDPTYGSYFESYVTLHINLHVYKCWRIYFPSFITYFSDEKDTKKTANGSDMSLNVN